jgi:hypothetical protein
MVDCRAVSSLTHSDSFCLSHWMAPTVLLLALCLHLCRPLRSMPVLTSMPAPLCAWLIESRLLVGDALATQYISRCKGSFVPSDLTTMIRTNMCIKRTRMYHIIIKVVGCHSLQIQDFYSRSHKQGRDDKVLQTNRKMELLKIVTIIYMASSRWKCIFVNVRGGARYLALGKFFRNY